MLAPARVGGLRERRESERNKLQPQRFLKPTPRPAPILADDADTPSLAVAFDKLGLPDAARCAARFGTTKSATRGVWSWRHSARASSASATSVLPPEAGAL